MPLVYNILHHKKPTVQSGPHCICQQFSNQPEVGTKCIFEVPICECKIYDFFDLLSKKPKKIWKTFPAILLQYTTTYLCGPLCNREAVSGEKLNGLS